MSKANTSNTEPDKKTEQAAVIDTNVVLDLIYWEDPHSEDLRRALEEGRIHALRSGEAVMELAEVLSRPAFTGDEDEAARLAALWCSMSV